MATSELPNDEFVLPKQKTIWDNILRMLRRQPLGSAGAVVIILMAFAAVFAETIAPFDPELENFEYMLSPPGTVHEDTGKVFYFGTDSFGRDQLSRMIYGARTALLVGFTASFCGAFLGLILGVASAYFGGYIDLVLQRVCDVFMAFPLIIMALAIVSIFGTGVEMVIIHYDSIYPKLCPSCQVECTSPKRSPIHRRCQVGRIWPRSNYYASHGSQCHGAVLDYAHGFCWPSNID